MGDGTEKEKKRPVHACIAASGVWLVGIPTNYLRSYLIRIRTEVIPFVIKIIKIFILSCQGIVNFKKIAMPLQ